VADIPAGNVLRTTDKGQTVARVTAIPSTPESSGGGTGVPADAIFTTPEQGIVFIAGTNRAYRTTDGGQSWTPVADIPAGNVQRLKGAYAFGPNTLLRNTDTGWQALDSGGATITGVSCATATLCLLTTDRGDRLLRMDNDKLESITASTAPLYAAGFANPSRAVAAGSGGATAVSNDGGRNYTPVGGDIAGSFQFGLRLGPAPNIALALGARGQLARTTDSGLTWKAINVATSSDMRDTSFSTPDDGYALDVRGGLFRTVNGGASWQPIDPGTTATATAVITKGTTVLLATRSGLRRATQGGAFDGVKSGGKVNSFDRAGSTLFAYGPKTILRSSDGRRWTKVKAPKRLADLDMTSAKQGYALDTGGRVWRTTNAKRWTELAAVGTADGLSLAFGSANSGYLTLRAWPADNGVAYVQRTTDGGKHWRPQRIASGTFPGTEGVISPNAIRSYALTSTPAAGNNVFRSLFTTSTGGDAGSDSRLSLKRGGRSNGRTTLNGRLSGAQGGEPIVVSARAKGSNRWVEQVVTAGANGGRFTAAFRIAARAQFVARWAGDSGRRGAGSSVLNVTKR
jgi:photosystem II stability/assembly factor-like uncharacterized protein